LRVLSLSSYEKLKNPPPNVIPSEEHCGTCAIKLNKEMKDMLNAVQTRSNEPDAGVLKRDNEE